MDHPASPEKQNDGPDLRDDLERIGRFLARRDVESLDPDRGGRRFDVLVLCGSAVLASLDVASRAFRDGLVDRLLVTGGFGHSTSYLEAALCQHPTYSDVPTAGLPEAAVFAEILQRHLAVPASAVVTETESTNCGENAELSLKVLRSWSRPVSSVLLIQDPTMQRRTHAAFEHRQSEAADPIRVISYAPFIPVVTAGGVGGNAFGDNAVGGEPDESGATWTLDRFTSLALGEIRRLNDDEDGYGPRGANFIGHLDIPDDVLTAYRRVLSDTPAHGRLR